MHFLIPSEQNRRTAFLACLEHVVPLAAASGEVAIAVHSRQNVPGSAIEEVFGGRDTRLLLKGNVLRGDVIWHLITERRRSSFRRGPIVAAYVSPRFLAKLEADNRATDVIYLPWNRLEEAAFFHAKNPQVIAPPGGWQPLSQDALREVETRDKQPAVTDVRESLSAEERVSSVEHTIDPGFVNHRRIETILGDDGRAAINRAITALPQLPDWQRNLRVNHIYSSLLLTFCRAVNVPPLGRAVAQRRGRVFCSTENLGPCRDLYKTERAVSRWRPLSRPQVPVEFHYSTAHIFSDTLRSELRSGGQVSIIAELFSAVKDRIIFHPLVMGGPWLESPDPRWKDVAAWWCNEFYENVIEDFSEFVEVKKFPKPLSCEPMRSISEHAFKRCLAEIIGGEVPKDWGGETSDFFASHLHLGGKRVSGAFLLKGPARFRPMTLNHLGKGNDQIVRLSSEPADVLFVQHCHEISTNVRATLRAFAVQPSRPRRYCLIDGRDSLWILESFGLYEKARVLSKSQTR